MRGFIIALTLAMAACSGPGEEHETSPADLALQFVESGEYQLLSAHDRAAIPEKEFFWPGYGGAFSEPSSQYHGLEMHLRAMMKMRATEVSRDGEAVKVLVFIEFPRPLKRLSSAFAGRPQFGEMESLNNLHRRFILDGLQASDLAFEVAKEEITVLPDGIYLGLAPLGAAASSGD